MYFGERKNGCRFFEFIFHGYRSLLIENDCIRTTLLLDKGTDIISFVDKKTDTDFVWTNPMGFSCLDKIRLGNMDRDCYSDNYLGGWFEILPNMGGNCTYAGKSFPGHGEVSYLPWNYTVVKDEEEEIELLFMTRLSKYPFELKKWLTVKKGVSSLLFREEVRNMGSRSLEYMWAWHPNVGSPFLNEDCVVELPFEGVAVPVPAPGTMRNEILDFVDVRMGKAIIRNKKTGQGIAFSWDTSVYKHCKIWLCAENDGGHHHHGGAYVACVLPCSSASMDLDKAAAKGHTLRLEGYGRRESYFSVNVDCGNQRDLEYKKKVGRGGQMICQQ